MSFVCYLLFGLAFINSKSARASIVALKLVSVGNEDIVKQEEKHFSMHRNVIKRQRQLLPSQF